MSYYYPIAADKIDGLKMKIDAEIQNLEVESEILASIVHFVYSGSVFNKRYETQLHKYLGDKFGRVELEQENWRGEKFYNNVSCYMQDSISFNDQKKYEVNISFRGVGIGYDYDNKKAYITSKSETHKFYSITKPEEVTEYARGRVEGIAESIEKLKTTKRRIKTLVNQHNALIKSVSEFNDLVPYIVSEELKVK